MSSKFYVHLCYDKRMAKILLLWIYSKIKTPYIHEIYTKKRNERTKKVGDYFFFH